MTTDVLENNLHDLLEGKIGTEVSVALYGWDIENECIRFNGAEVDLDEDCSDIDLVDLDLSTMLVTRAPDDSYRGDVVDQGFCKDVDGTWWWLDIINDGLAYKVIF